MAGGPIVTVVKGAGRGSAVSRGTTEPRPVRWILTAVAVLFLVLFIVLPAANVFAQAMKHGWRAYVSVMRPSVDEARVAQIQEKLKDKSVPFRERRKLSKELSEELSPVEKARKNWSAVRLTFTRSGAPRVTVASSSDRGSSDSARACLRMAGWGKPE